jgi:hypothetical protein
LARDPADADDPVQFRVERVLVRQGRWQAGTRLDSWVFHIMKNEIPMGALATRLVRGRMALQERPEGAEI